MYLPCLWDDDKITRMKAIQTLILLTPILKNQLRQKLHIIVEGLKPQAYSGDTYLQELTAKAIRCLLDNLGEYQDELIEL